MEVKSPYNFVPAPTEAEVYKPDWASQVSHDIPFSDGESGEIELKITAMTPIFIRNGHSKNQETNEFSHYFDKDGKKHYFIPGSSLKGMFRNVLEIMSFSRMNPKLVNDDRYSYRDLSKHDNLYMTNYKKYEIRGGWLGQDKSGNWHIEECSEIAFIHHEELNTKAIPFRDLFLDKNPKDKSAKYKYKLIDSKLLNAKFSIKEVTLFGGVKRKIAVYDANGKAGTLVFTGQSSKRQEPVDDKSTGKVHEFVFFSDKNPKILKVEDKMIKDFKFIYLDHDKNNISPDWKFWRDNYLEKDLKIPVFYSKDENGNLYHFGLSYMYKLPYKNSVHQSNPLNSYKKELDLTNTLFGYSEKDNGLKGRIMIGNAQLEYSINSSEYSLQKEILGGPKASFFPFYLEQKRTNSEVKKYFTFEDSNAKIRGFKRYPIHSKIFSGSYDEKQLQNSKVFSTFKPLKSGSAFTCKIRFHNLKKVEIGALLSAITFHGLENNTFHSLGGAKPFGYGKVSVSVCGLKELTFTKEDYLAEFESLMGGEKWLNSDALKELITMAQFSHESLKYPDNPKTFLEYKKQKLSLQPYSEIVNQAIKIKSFVKYIETQAITSFDFLKTRLKDLKYQVKENLWENGVPESIQNNLKEALFEIYQNHTDSKRKLIKDGFDGYEWKNTISNWVGKTTAEEWYNEITKK